MRVTSSEPVVGHESAQSAMDQTKLLSLELIGDDIKRCYGKILRSYTASMKNVILIFDDVSIAMAPFLGTDGHILLRVDDHNNESNSLESSVVPTKMKFTYVGTDSGREYPSIWDAKTELEKRIGTRLLELQCWCRSSMLFYFERQPILEFIVYKDLDTKQNILMWEEAQ